MKRTRDEFRILTPGEYERLRDQCPKTRLRAGLDFLLFTGMRYSEARRACRHIDEWFDEKNRAIIIPAEHTKTNRRREVHLTPAYTKQLSLYLREWKTLDLPHQRTFERNMARWWGIDINNWYPTPKTLRKTWESWLIYTGYDPMKVALSQGHSQVIQMHHYASMSARLKSEVDAVKRLTEGWMT